MNWMIGLCVGVMVSMAVWNLFDGLSPLMMLLTLVLWVWHDVLQNGGVSDA